MSDTFNNATLVQPLAVKEGDEVTAVAEKSIDWVTTYEMLRSRLAAQEAENERLTQSVDKWARFSERHGWLDPEDFDAWIEKLKADAERYRWLKRSYHLDMLLSEIHDPQGDLLIDEALEDAIDKEIDIMIKEQNDET